jgi:hypothetical protein
MTTPASQNRACLGPRVIVRDRETGKPIHRKGREGRKGTFSEIPSEAREPYSVDEHPGME